MKNLHRFYLLFLVFILFACGVPSQSNLGKNERDEDKEREIRQLVADNEHVKITVLNMKKIKNQSKTTVTITFDILNKRKDAIIISAQRLSVDERMVDETIYEMHQEISPQKAANARLIIQQADEIEFPEFKNDLEMEMHISSTEDPSYFEKHPVKIIFS